jgi:integrase/recombinase XerD
METLRERMRGDLELRGSSRNTVDAYLRCMTQLADFYGTCPSQLSQEHIRLYLLHLLRERRLSAGTVCVHVAALKFLYATTLRRASFAAALAYPRNRRRSRSVLSPSEVGQALNAARTARTAAMASVLYGAGLRISELCALRVEDIDSKRHVIRIRQGKGGKSRQVMLSARLLHALRTYWKTRRHNASPYLFPGPAGGPITRNTVSKILVKLGNDAGLAKRLTAHVLRHSFATHLVENGCDVRTLQLLLGHSRINTTAIYLQLSNSHLIAVQSPLERLDKGE